MKSDRARLGLFIGLVLLLVGIDQGVKGLVVEKLSPVGSHPLLPGLVQLSYRENYGVAFSMFHFLPPAVMAGIVILVLGLFLVLAFPHLRTRRGMLAAALIVGGALGNLVDRMTRGYVVDYVDLYVNGRNVWPVFNIADAAIVVGVGLLIVSLLLSDRSTTPAPGGELT